MTPVECRLLQRIQVSFPISTDPYGELAAAVGCAGGEAYERVARWRGQGLIRRLGPIYDPAALGRSATLCAGQCPPSELSRVARALMRFDEVTHAYLREGQGTNLNLWFTLSASSRAALDEQVKAVERRMRLGPVISLPTRRVFKVRAVFDLEAGEKVEGARSKVEGRRKGKTSGALPPFDLRPSTFDLALVAATQRGLPDGLDPYGQVAAGLGLDRRRVLEALRGMLQSGVIRRVGAVLDQRQLGLRGNCLVAWRVPADRVEEAGLALAAEPAISHCCERDTAPRWPYNIYTMVHAADEGACVQLLEGLARQVGQPPRAVLFTRRELKKAPPRYA